MKTVVGQIAFFLLVVTVSFKGYGAITLPDRDQASREYGNVWWLMYFGLVSVVALDITAKRLGDVVGFDGKGLPSNPDDEM